MCRLLAIKNFDHRVHASIFNGFADLAEKGKTLPGDAPGHNDGWGIAWYAEGKASLFKSAGSIEDERSKYLQILEEIGSTHFLIAHLRKSAWPNSVSTKNSHPFTYGNYAFAHNGTIRDYKRLLTDIHLEGHSLDMALDSEIFFHYVLHYISTGLKSAFSTASRNIRTSHQFSSLTCILSDGKNLLAHRDAGKFPDYYALYHRHANGADIIASEPLVSAEDWRLLNEEESLVL